MDLAYCKLGFKIRKYESISAELIQEYIKNKKHPFLSIANLFYDFPIPGVLFNNIYNYIINFLHYFFIFNTYNFIEQQWYIFYVLLRAYHDSDKDRERIVNKYKQLPNCNSNKMEIQWVIYQVKTEMLSYYINNNLDYSLLLNEIASIPQQIKDLHY